MTMIQMAEKYELAFWFINGNKLLARLSVLMQ